MRAFRRGRVGVFLITFLGVASWQMSCRPFAMAPAMNKGADRLDRPDEAPAMKNEADHRLDRPPEDLLIVAHRVMADWENATSVKIPFKFVRSNPLLPPFVYGFPEGESDQQQVNQQQILEPYVSLKLAKHLRACCVDDDGRRGHFLDVGGNFGWYALLAAASGCDVDSFEPVDWFRNVLEASADVNAFVENGRLIVHPLVVGDEPGLNLTVKIPVSATSLMGAAGVGGMNLPTMNTKGLATLTLEKETTTIDYIGIKPKHFSCGMKVDVEGFEPKVCSGGKKFISENLPPIMILELSPGMTSEGVPEMLKQLRDLGYTAHQLSWPVIKSKDASTWVQPLSMHTVEWEFSQITRNCGYNCMLVLTKPGFD